METSEKLKFIQNVIEDMKAERVSVLDVHAKTSIADYFVVCSATSDIHMRSIAEKVKVKLKEHQVPPLRLDSSSPEWVLLDYGDILLHIMKEETRQFYDLEGLWKSVQVNQDII